MKTRIAIIGVRGIPVVYSGFETFAEELSTRLVKQGYEVTVFCRRKAVKGFGVSYKGVNRVILGAISLKGLETFSHSLLSTLQVCLGPKKYEIVYYLGVGSSLFSLFPRLRGIKTIVNVDGLDYKREKWGWVGKAYLLISETLAILFANVTLTDSEFIKKYYQEKYKKQIEMIPYGYDPIKPDLSILKKYALERRKYLVWTGRLVPDNHLDELLEARRGLVSEIPLVVLGEAERGSGYESRLKNGDWNEGVRYLGFVDRATYAAIVAGSSAYIETKRSGGTHPSLLESMGYGCLVVCNDHLAHVEVLGKTARYYKAGEVKDLKMAMREILDNLELQKWVRLRREVKARARERYSWSSVVRRYTKLFQRLLNTGDDELTEVKSVGR